MQLVLEQPFWYLIMCLALGVGLSGLLYYKRKKTNSNSVALIVLAILRSLGITLLAILLLNPLIKYVESRLEKPVVFLMVDNSQSMMLGSDSAYVRSSLKADVSKWKSELEETYDVVSLDGDELTFDDAITDLSKPLQNINKLYDGRQPAAAVIVSDGIYNSGSNPSFVAQKLGVPVYTIALGDTTIQTDVSIYNAKANSITFLGNEFPVEVVVNANKLDGQQVELSVWEGSEKLDQTKLQIAGSKFSTKHTFLLKANKIGSHQLAVRVSSVAGETNLMNNEKLVYTDVIDAKQKILLLAHAAHPDVSVLRQALEANDQYEVTVQTTLFKQIGDKEYDLVIGHQLPINSYEYNTLQNVKELGIPFFLFVGAQTNIPLFNKLDMGFQISGNKQNFNQAQPKENTGFRLFELDEEVRGFMQNAPPLTSPFGDYSEMDESYVLSYQSIGGVSTKMPLWSFANKNNFRSGVCSGEGLWRWRFNDYEENGDFEQVSTLLRKTVQYLALKDDKRKFRMSTSEKSFYENENISFIAEVFNASYEYTKDATVTVDVKSDKGDEYSYTLLPGNASYNYVVGALPAGMYSFTATAQYNGNKYTEAGNFLVKELQLENQNLTANHQILKQVALESGGMLYAKEDWDKLASVINELPNNSTIVKESNRFKDLISQKWIFYLIFFLFAIEWFARRWIGGY